MISRRELLLAGIVSGVPFAATASSERRSYMLGSSLIEDIVKDLTDGDAATRLFVSGSACPGHTDVKASDLIFALHSNGIFVHPPQIRLSTLSQMFAAESAIREKTHAVDVAGSWLIPTIQAQASCRIAELLQENETAPFKSFVKRRLKQRLEKLAGFSSELTLLRERFLGKTVIASAMQKEFLTWCGLNVAAVFGSADSLDPKTLVNLFREVKGKKIDGVVDNLQSGSEAGFPIASELGLGRVVLSNFPGSAQNVPDYFSLVRENVRLLLSLIGA